MPISDSCIVQYLLQETKDGGASVLWSENDSEGYTACIRGMRVRLESVPSRAGSRLCLSISHVQDRIHIEEPPNIGVFGKKYGSEEQRRLAELMSELARLVERQCASRRERLAAGADEVRQTVYRRLIGAVPAGD